MGANLYWEPVLKGLGLRAKLTEKVSPKELGLNRDAVVVPVARLLEDPR